MKGGFTSGLSTSLHDVQPHVHGDLVLSRPVLEGRHRYLRPNASGSKKSQGSKKKHGLETITTSSKKSSKKGGYNNVVTSQPSNEVANTTTVITPAQIPTEPTINNPSVPTKSDPPQPCNNHVDCIKNACGFETIESTGSKVCCPSGATYSDYCTQPLGAACSVEDELCISGICAGVVCVDGPQPDGGSCDNGLECASGECARQRAEDTSPLACCPEGAGSVLVFVLFLDPAENFACGQQPTGAACWTVNGMFNDDICASGKCGADFKCA